MKPTALLVAAALATLLLGLPLCFFPLRWAKVVGWALPEDRRLTRYFGRCLGAVVLALSALAVYAARHEAAMPAALGTTAGALLLMVPVHVAGAVRREQPPFETWEIPFYLGAGSFFTWLALSG